jgi:8-oxo-dGTP diphosphatase
VVVVERWTGGRACLLQAALRHTNAGFAQDLGVGVRTVAGWHEMPSLVPRTEVQQLLDIALERASGAAQERFARLQAEAAPAGGAQALTVAVAVVQRADSVLLVCRRDESASGLRWQFPAGVVKPGADPGAVAVSETLGETGVHAAVRAHLGRRVHPLTGVVCEYVLCDYLTGQARNADTLENLDATWVPIASLARFVPLDAVYPPILTALESDRDAAD